jgi:hypothetical protein
MPIPIPIPMLGCEPRLMPAGCELMPILRPPLFARAAGAARTRVAMAVVARIVNRDGMIVLLV